MVYCPECGFKLPENAAFCPNCGQSLKTQDTAAPEYERETSPAEAPPGVSPAPPPAAPGTQPNPSLYYGSAWSEPNPTGSSYGAPANGYGYQSPPRPNMAPPAKSGNSKTALIVILSVVVLLVVATLLIVIAMNGKKPADRPSESFGVSTQYPSSGVIHNNIAGSGYIEGEDYYVSFIGAESFVDVDNDPAIRIYYEFTNYCEVPQCAYYSLDYTATQDGLHLEYAYSWEDVETYYYRTLNVRTGLTIQCCLQFKYNPNGGKINLDMYGWSGEESTGKVSCTYIPGNLPGAPAKYVFQSYVNPKWTLALNSSGYLDDDEFYVAVTGAELVEDRYGEQAVRVFYDFTNNTEDPVSMYNALYVYAYQDGISLFISDAEFETETDKNFKVEVSSGKTIKASCVFRLRNEVSQIEAEVEASRSYDAIGETFMVK